MIGGQVELAQEKASSPGKLSMLFAPLNWANIGLQQLRRTHLRYHPYVQHTILFKTALSFLLWTYGFWFPFFSFICIASCARRSTVVSLGLVSSVIYL